MGQHNGTITNLDDGQLTSCSGDKGYYGCIKCTDDGPWCDVYFEFPIQCFENEPHRFDDCVFDTEAREGDPTHKIYCPDASSSRMGYAAYNVQPVIKELA